MKWPFRRNKDQTDVPAEIQEYYQTERRERTGVAWLLALGTLLVTVGLATLLFFGGRWLYRTVANRGDGGRDNVSQVEQEQGSEGRNRGDGSKDEGSARDNDGQTSSTNTRDSDQPGGGTAQGSQSTPPAAPSRTTSPTTGDNLPDTGPGNVVGLFMATTVTAATAHYALNTRRRS